MPQHFERRCEDCEIIFVPEANAGRKAVGERAEVRGRPDRYTKERFTVACFAVVTEYIEAGEEGAC